MGKISDPDAGPLCDKHTDPTQDIRATIVYMIAKTTALIFCPLLIAFAIADPKSSASGRAHFEMKDVPLRSW